MLSSPYSILDLMTVSNTRSLQLTDVQACVQRGCNCLIVACTAPMRLRIYKSSCMKRSLKHDELAMTYCGKGEQHVPFDANPQM